MDNLTPKQKRFCDEYLIDLNGTQAAIRSGYSKKTANRIADQNLSKLVIKACIDQKKQELAEQSKIKAEEVLKDLISIKNRCLAGEPIMQYNEKTKQYEDTGKKRYETQSALKACELLGKHLGIFEEDNRQKQIMPLTPEKRKQLAKDFGFE